MTPDVRELCVRAFPQLGFVHVPMCSCVIHRVRSIGYVREYLCARAHVPMRMMA